MELESREQHEVLSTIQFLNACWKRGDVEGTGAFYHEDAVMAFPGFEGGARGREAHVAGYRDFITSCLVHQYSEDNLRIDVSGSTAVVTYTYHMIYEREGRKYDAKGRDFYVLEKNEEEWLIVWRTMLDAEDKEIPAE